jgi:MATE family multidrug resistance protein
MVMALQLVGLTLKVPLTALLVFGADLPLPAGWPWSEWRIPSLGTPGCGIATAIAMAVQLLVAPRCCCASRPLRSFGLHTRRLQRPDPRLAALLRLGVPMGVSIGTQVTASLSPCSLRDWEPRRSGPPDRST